MSSQQKPDENYPEVGIAFRLSSEANKTLTISANRSERVKKSEAKLRLEDHLKRFPDWKL
ncbi:TraY domain-containing protein [Vibrio mediterranei]|uniref:TraY domain-containing protein n=1 Tax=Vibrio mediterranei TaxID=689 RepID=UPI00148DB0D1|nr:TraY domain-containing protein [Vibrio mediterranei]NOI26697.1 TraY domain-containing protein [Vibrio mediterranei]